MAADPRRAFRADPAFQGLPTISDASPTNRRLPVRQAARRNQRGTAVGSNLPLHRLPADDQLIPRKKIAVPPARTNQHGSAAARIQPAVRALHLNDRFRRMFLLNAGLGGGPRTEPTTAAVVGQRDWRFVLGLYPPLPDRSHTWRAPNRAPYRETSAPPGAVAYREFVGSAHPGGQNTQQRRWRPRTSSEWPRSPPVSQK